jgi:hypothetical protein
MTTDVLPIGSRLNVVIDSENSGISKFKSAFSHCSLEPRRERVIGFASLPNGKGKKAITLSNPSVEK